MENNIFDDLYKDLLKYENHKPTATTLIENACILMYFH